jgi:galactokinase/mevalonate kinase-like predicted kinase
MNDRIQHLVSLPPQMARAFAGLEQRTLPDWFAAADPPDVKLGSGGATAQLLVSAWKADAPSASLPTWLRQSRKLIVHGGGQSRRLPAYAAVGKPLMPVPVFRWSRGQRLDQTLLDLQLPAYRRVLAHAPREFVTLLTSGDVLLRFGKDLPAFPRVDVLGLGMWVTPERARDFGVFFVPRAKPSTFAFFLQKPTPARIRELAGDHLYLVDTGMWLLSERAVAVLLRRSGWEESRQVFADGTPAFYEFYGHFCRALGETPEEPDPEVGALSCAVVPLPEPEFYHFGTSRQLIESLSALQNRVLDESKLGLVGARRHPDQYVQNARVAFPLRQEENHTLWVENSVVPASWHLASRHVLTGVPDNTWDLRLEAGVCLDFVPVGDTAFCVRAYGIEDAFAGAVGEARTLWFGQPASNWFFARGLDRQAAAVRPEGDMQEAPLFPVLLPAQLEPRFLEWLFTSQPQRNEGFARRWLDAPRLSAAQIPQKIEVARLVRQRAENRNACLLPLVQNQRWSVFFRLDLESTAKLFALGSGEFPEGTASTPDATDPMQPVREQMVRAAVWRHRGRQDWSGPEDAAFSRLRALIEREAQLTPALPRRSVQDDQIVWGRSPVRLDLAGGWTDTPPYCLEHGGRVVNLAVDLNGQPPLQVFARVSERPELVIRSIDLGVEQRIGSYEALETFAQPGSEFALAKAAFALVGFLPRFHATGGFRSLREQLEDFGGGIEISLLAAVPKGSGLGTSSILSATLLATLGDLCGLSWDRTVLFARTLALEQMVTTGGGWQDQAGGIFRGTKLIETTAGLCQKPTLRWLPDQLFDRDYANKSILLYYTGLTRLAKGILHEVVRGVFLNSPAHLDTLEAIGANADVAFNALQRADYAALAASVRASWQLNQRLDAGTNPPEVSRILEPIADHLLAAKLLGAGGGGYLLLLAKDPEAAARIRRALKDRPPNAKARMVDFALSNTGLQLTRS